METHEYEIDLREIFDIVRARLWIIVIVVLLTTITASVVSFFFLDRVYEASTKMIIAKGPDSDFDINDLRLSQSLVGTYGEIASSHTTSARVIRNLNLNMTPKAFASKVQVNSVRNTEVIDIRVQNTNPHLAARIADELSVVFSERIASDFPHMPSVILLDYALVPTSPIRPRPTLNMAIAMVLGVMIGVGIIFLLEYLDNTFKGPDDVEKKLKLPILGAVPLIKGSENNIKLVTFSDPKSPVSEAYRMLRTNIQFSNLDNRLKTIVVTSTGPSEGKSTSISNLAITMVNQGNKVLLIDADLRKPQIHKLFKLDNELGMTSVLMGEKMEDAIKSISGMKLDVLTSGPIPPNPSELLGSNSMKRFLEECRELYDVVLIDSPPTGVVTDSAVLSTIADGTLYVVAVGQALTDQTLKAKDMLSNVKANIIGIIVNKVNVDKKKYQNYYSYYLEE